MKKSTKCGLIGAVIGIAAVGLAPFELKKEENGDFTYKSLLLGFTKKHDEDIQNTTVTFFNKPDFSQFQGVGDKICDLLHKCKRETVTVEFYDDDESAESIAQDVPQTEETNNEE